MAVECTPSGLKSLHQQLVDSFNLSLHGKLSWHCPIDPSKTDAWAKAHFHGDVSFDLVSEVGAISQAEHRVGTNVVSMRADPEWLWMSWKEKWLTSRGTSGLSLTSAGFTFYWGDATEINDVLFRAEWGSDESGDKGAQPHWHMDLSNTVTVDRVHFGMSGWKHGNVCPSNWQYYAANENDLKSWACETLRYVNYQFEHYPPSMA